MRTGRVMRWFTFLAMLGAAGCGADPSADPSANEHDGAQVHEGKSTLLAVASRGGRTLEFRGSAAGDILEIEYGSLDEVALTPDPTDRFDFVGRYELLTGNEAPLALREAQARLDQLRVETGDAPEIVSPAQRIDAIDKDVGRAWPKPVSRSAFRDNYCVKVHRDWFEFEVHEGRRQWDWTGVNYWRAGVFNGAPTHPINVRLEYWWSVGNEVMDRSLPAGHYMALRVSSALDASARVTVTSFHVPDYDLCVNYHF